MDKKSDVPEKTPEDLRAQLGFEKQVNALFSRFLDISPDLIDGAINDACGTIGEFTGSSCCFFVLVRETGGTVERTYEWRRKGVAPFSDRGASENIRRVLGSAARVREEAYRDETSLYVPLLHQGHLFGIAGVESKPGGTGWSPDTSLLLKAAGKIFINSIVRKRTEEQLAYKQSVLSILMDNIPDTNIYFKDLDSRFTIMNKSQAEMMGLDDPALAIGKTDADFFDDAQQFLIDERKIIQTGNGLIGKLEKVIKQNGTFHWYSSTKMPVRDAGGAVIGTFGISRDFTQVKEYEDELRKAKELLEIRVEERTVDLRKSNERLESHVAQLNFLDAASYALSQSMLVDKLLPSILALFLRRFPRADGGLCRRGEGGFRCVNATGAFDNEDGRKICAAVCDALHPAGLSKIFVIKEWKNDDRARALPLPGGPGVTSYIALPLCVDTVCKAVIQIFMYEGVYSGQEDTLLATLAAHAAICLSNALRQEELKAKARLDGELEAARSIQDKFTPHYKPPVPRINIKGAYFPAYEVGGDYLDYFQAGNGAWVVVAADICGKGIPAALLMTMLRSTFRIEAKYETSARGLLCSVNDFLVQNVDDRSFVTALCLVINGDGTGMTYARAGHPRLIHIDPSSKTVEEVFARGMALGITADTAAFGSGLEEVSLALKKGDKYLLYTDGLIEATDPDDAQYGSARLRTMLEENMESDPETLVEQLLQDVKKFIRGAPAYDDLTILAMEVE
jgi:PAS domain S-box-containing protein